VSNRRAAILMRRVLAALLLVAFPAMSAAMVLVGPASHPSVAHAHAGHHGTPQHPPGHQQCCDLCGAACACTLHAGTPGLAAPVPVVALHALSRTPAPAHRPTRVAHLLPLALGPPAPLV
jgi:hypothetical protein